MLPHTFSSLNDARMGDHLVAEARTMRHNVIANAFKAIGRGVRNVYAAAADARRMRETYFELSTMSDRQLADMGITRGDIPAVVAGTFRRETVTPVVAITPKAQPEAAPAAEDVRQAA